MIVDYYRTLTKRVVTKVVDSGGGFTETTSDTTIYGWIGELSGSEVLKNQQIGNNATAELFTNVAVKMTDRVVDGAVEYEVVWPFQNPLGLEDLRYLLKRVK